MAVPGRRLLSSFARSGWLPLVLVTLPIRTAAGYDVPRTVFSGGAVEASGEYRLLATVGEAGVVGRTSGLHDLREGFWAGHFRLVATGAPELEGPAGSIAWANGLRQSFPNPFRGSTTIAYTVGHPSPVRVAVYDVSGRHVATLTDMEHDPGLYRVSWEGRDTSGNRVASGVYFYRLDIGSWATTKKLLKLR